MEIYMVLIVPAALSDTVLFNDLLHQLGEEKGYK